jgi:hypothetical protein
MKLKLDAHSRIHKHVHSLHMAPVEAHMTGGLLAVSHKARRLLLESQL